LADERNGLDARGRPRDGPDALDAVQIGRLDALDGRPDGVRDGIRDVLWDGCADGVRDGVRDGVWDGCADGVGVRDGLWDGRGRRPGRVGTL